MKIVAWTLLIYFSFGALIPRGDFSQLTKLDDLAEHYDLHREEASLCGEELAFPDFLYLHFIEGVQHEHDDSEHENLPLQNIASPVFFIAEIVADDDFQPELISVLNISFPSFFQKKFITSVFHPPSEFIA